MIRIESLLSARRYMTPQLVGNRLYFISDLNGRLSLYVMDEAGSVPEPLLPPQIALQNPHLTAIPYAVFPALGKILLMLDDNGDENYQPMLIPLEGGYPEPAFGDTFARYRCHCVSCDVAQNILYLASESRDEALIGSYRGNLATGEVLKLGESRWGMGMEGRSSDHRQVVLAETYTFGDSALFLWQASAPTPQLLYGKPLDQRAEGEELFPASISAIHFTADDRGLLFLTALFEDTYSLGFLHLDEPKTVKPVLLTGLVHTGIGEMEGLRHLAGNRYGLLFNIDGCSWLYEAVFDVAALTMQATAVICGQGSLANGVLDAYHYDKASDRFALSLSTATSPTQLYTVAGTNRQTVICHTRERLLGLPDGWLSPGEDASFISHDGLRVSARLYLPAAALGFDGGQRPLVYYVHGGPQGQERPDFAWFSMPLIQFLTLNGFAVFVPNVRGSTGYGLSYMKRVDHDWGGQDRLDHVHALQVLAQDERLDVGRTAVIGRSYGGYMTLTLAARHPELWAAAVDMFGPYDLLTFTERLPETWKPYFAIAVGDPEKDRDFLVERSPRTYIQQLTCPMLVIQGKNDPRVIEQESRDVVEQLQAAGKEVDYLMFEDEGHDVLKYDNRVRCYNTISQFLQKHLMPG